MDFWRKHKATLSAGLVIAVIFFAIGFNRGVNHIPAAPTALINTTSGEPGSVDFTAFWKAWNVINDKYVAASTTKKAATEQDKVYGAIKGLAASLGDPYTVFFPPVESEQFATDIRGDFEGVGMEIAAQDGAITVIAPLKDSPAAKAGIMSGDRILKIGDKDTSTLSTDDAAQLIRGPKGSKITLSILRKNVKAPFDVSVTRDVINIPTIATAKLAGGIFKIDLYSFTASSPNLFRDALREFIQSGNQKLILDLRGDPGGYLEAAIDMASWFLPSGKVVVRESFGGGQDEQVYRSKGYDIFKNNLKFVILVDKGSASASEILAGALSEQGVAKLVGDTTFGKGSVQELINITPDTSLKVTIARWLTPSGKSISEQGITPDYVVKRTQDDVDAGKDPQLDKAIEILNQ